MTDERNIVKKYSVAEIVLFLIFVAGVVIGIFLVAARGRIELSAPISLGHSGVAAPVPVGPGWQSSETWTYEQPNQFVLSATLQTGTQLVAMVQYQYLLAAADVDPARFLDETARAARLRIAHRGTTGDGLQFEWVQLQAQRSVPDVVIGVASLAHGRALVIHVRTPGDHLLAMKLFKAVAAATVYKPQEQIARGAEFVGRMKAAGLTQLVGDCGGFEGETVFMIRDNFDRARGFQILQFRRNAEPRDWWVLKGDRVHFTEGVRGGLSKSHMESDDAFGRYNWFTERSRNRRGVIGDSDIRLSADGDMQIGGGLQLEDIRCRPAVTVPEMLIAQAARAYLDEPGEETIINILSDRGNIVPTVMTASNGSQDEDNVWQAVHCVRLEYLYPDDSETRFYFDGGKRLVGRVDGRGRTLIWAVSDRGRLKEAFGDVEGYTGANGPAQ